MINYGSIIQKRLQKHASFFFVLPPFPSHTQSVERLVREVTDACGLISGHERRDGFIRARMASRKKAPKSETKRDFALLL